jgi:penicillin-binding protein 1A
MSKALKGKADLDKRQPNGIVTVKIDPKTGKRVAPSNKGIYEFFRTKNVPSAPDEDSSSSETELNPLPDDIF